ncbi:MAG: nitroreductase family protein [Promethearchaeota archaeon]
MPILGIDDDTCIKCLTCITTCARSLFKIINQEKIEFNDPQNRCILCGHCIARCPENAILYENMGQSFSYNEINNPEKILQYNDIFKFLLVHRSIRRYKKDKVSIELLQKVFDAMQYAPTASNMRSEHFSILSDKDKIKKLSDAVITELLKDPILNEKYGGRFKVLKSEFRSPIFFDSPHIIFVSSPVDTDIEANNIGIIVSYGRLAAHALGLGTCWNAWTQIAMASNPEIRKLAGIYYSKIGVFTIGYPDVIFYRTAPRTMKQIKGFENLNLIKN